jgi:hypothetical protein
VSAAFTKEVLDHQMTLRLKTWKENQEVEISDGNVFLDNIK